jgi:flagellar hook-associated protein 2
MTTGSISVSGLLGGTAGQIDVTSLISSLMQAAAVPQTQLQDQKTTEQSILTALQAVNTRTTAMQSAAQALTDPTAWTATTVASSSSAVVANSDGTAPTGSITFDVVQTAQAQVSTVAADASGNVVSDPSAGITVTTGDGTAHFLALASGSASAVATAINNAGIGVRASVVTTDSGIKLQLTSAKTGAGNGFTATGLDSPPQTVVSARDAQIKVGDPASGGYTVSSASNTFTGVFSGITFSVSGPASAVTLQIDSDGSSLATKVKALVDAANTVRSAISVSAGQGGVLQGSLDVSGIGTDIGSAVSLGGPNGESLKTYGIDMDKNGVLSFDQATFLAAWQSDPDGVKAAISGAFAGRLQTTAGDATAPITGTLSASIAATQATSQRLDDEISQWTDRLADIKDRLVLKYTAMETALSRLQSQQTWLSSVLNSINGNSSSSSSSSSG